jgi:hypothetical protein
MSTDAIVGFAGLLLIAVLGAIGITFAIREDRATKQKPDKSLLEALRNPSPGAKSLQRLAWIAMVGLVLILVVARVSACST